MGVTQFPTCVPHPTNGHIYMCPGYQPGDEITYGYTGVDVGTGVPWTDYWIGTKEWNYYSSGLTPNVNNIPKVVLNQDTRQSISYDVGRYYGGGPQAQNSVAWAKGNPKTTRLPDGTARPAGYESAWSRDINDVFHYFYKHAHLDSNGVWDGDFISRPVPTTGTEPFYFVPFSGHTLQLRPNSIYNLLYGFFPAGGGLQSSAPPTASLCTRINGELEWVTWPKTPQYLSLFFTLDLNGSTFQVPSEEAIISTFTGNGSIPGIPDSAFGPGGPSPSHAPYGTGIYTNNRGFCIVEPRRRQGTRLLNLDSGTQRMTIKPGGDNTGLPFHGGKLVMPDIGNTDFDINHQLWSLFQCGVLTQNHVFGDRSGLNRLAVHGGTADNFNFAGSGAGLPFDIMFSHIDADQCGRHMFVMEGYSTITFEHCTFKSPTRWQMDTEQGFRGIDVKFLPCDAAFAPTHASLPIREKSCVFSGGLQLWTMVPPVNSQQVNAPCELRNVTTHANGRADEIFVFGPCVAAYPVNTNPGDSTLVGGVNEAQYVVDAGFAANLVRPNWITRDPRASGELKGAPLGSTNSLDLLPDSAPIPADWGIDHYYEDSPISHKPVPETGGMNRDCVGSMIHDRAGNTIIPLHTYITNVVPAAAIGAPHTVRLSQNVIGPQRTGITLDQGQGHGTRGIHFKGCTFDLPSLYWHDTPVRGRTVTWFCGYIQSGWSKIIDVYFPPNPDGSQYDGPDLWTTPYIAGQQNAAGVIWSPQARVIVGSNRSTSLLTVFGGQPAWDPDRRIVYLAENFRRPKKVPSGYYWFYSLDIEDTWFSNWKIEDCKALNNWGGRHPSTSYSDHPALEIPRFTFDVSIKRNDFPAKVDSGPEPTIVGTDWSKEKGGAPDTHERAVQGNPDLPMWPPPTYLYGPKVDLGVFGPNGTGPLIAPSWLDGDPHWDVTDNNFEGATDDQILTRYDTVMNSLTLSSPAVLTSAGSGSIGPRYQTGTGTTITATATITSTGGAVPGTILFLVDGLSAATGTISSGSATVSLGALADGPHIITARYSGETSGATAFNESSYRVPTTGSPFWSSITIDVGTVTSMATETTLEVSPISGDTSTEFVLEATVTGHDPAHLVMGQLTVYDGLEIIASLPVNSSPLLVDTITLPSRTLLQGTHVFTASYLSSTPYNTSSDSDPLTLVVDAFTEPPGPDVGEISYP